MTVPPRETAERLWRTPGAFSVKGAKYVLWLEAALDARDATIRELTEALERARGYVEEPGSPGTIIETTEESAERAAQLLAVIDAVLARVAAGGQEA